MALFDVFVISGSLLILVGVTVVIDRRRSRHKAHESPEERYRREMVNLRPVPQTWRAKRSEARRAQRAKSRRAAWAAGTAGAVGAYGIGIPGGDNGGGDPGAFTDSGGCGGGFGCGGGGCGGGGCGGS